MKKILALVLTFAILMTLFVVPVTAETTTNRLVISDCDTLTGWTKTGGNGMKDMLLRTDGLDSSNSVASNVSYGAFRTITFAPSSPMDLSGYTYLEWDVRFHSSKSNGLAGTMWEQILASYVDNGQNAMYLKISSTGDNKCNIFRKSTMTITVVDSEWVHFKVKMDQPNTARNFDPSAFTAFYFSTTDGAANTAVDNGFIAIDNIVATKDVAVEPDPEPDPEPEPDPDALTKLLCDCSTTDGWVKTTGNALNVNASGYNSGFDTNSAIGCAVNGGAFRTATYTFPTAVDLTDYKYLEWDVRFYTSASHGEGTMWEQIQAAYGTNGNNTLVLRVFSSDNDYATFSLSEMNAVVSATNSEWVHFQVVLDHPTSTVGSFDLSAMKNFYFATVEGAVNSGVNDGVIRLDNIMAIKEETPEPEPEPDPDALAKLLCDCSTTDGWVKTGGGEALNVNANGYNSGFDTNSAIGCNVNYGAFRTVTYTFPTAVDLTDYRYLEWDVRFHTNKNNGREGTMWEQIQAAYGTNGNNQLLLKLSSSTTDYNVFRLSRMTATVSTTNPEWIHFSVVIDNPNTPVGTFDKSAVTSFYFATTDGPVDTTVDDGLVRIDNIMAVKEVHQYEETVVAPTCISQGYTLCRCTICHDEYKKDYTDMIPHNYQKTTHAPTCTEDGYDEYTCSYCGDHYVMPSGEPATGHQIENGSCTVCGLTEEAIQNVEAKTTVIMKYLQTAVQLKPNADSCDLRFISMLDSDLADYESVGFIMEIMGYEQKISTPTVYTSFMDETAGKITASQYGADYFILTTANVGSELYGEKITIRPYVELVGGGIIKGNSLEFVLNDYIGG
ncbi:MAG: hypothetical protein IKI29_00580 [Clostridia bacterium]|nr:hypothetical protein [Clostridia bacterium]